MPELLPVTEDDFLRLFTRLEALRQDLLTRMARDGLDLGLAAVVGHVNATLSALASTSPGAAERIIVADDAGPTIKLTSYRGADAVAVVEISPARAVGLASELLAAGARSDRPRAA